MCPIMPVKNHLLKFKEWLSLSLCFLVGEASCGGDKPE